MAADELRNIIRAVLDAAPGGAASVQKVEVRLRQQLGGLRVYIRKAPAERVAASIGESLLRGESIRNAFGAAGVSSATGYRALRRRCRSG